MADRLDRMDAAAQDYANRQYKDWVDVQSGKVIDGEFTEVAALIEPPTPRGEGVKNGGQE